MPWEWGSRFAIQVGLTVHGIFSRGNVRNCAHARRNCLLRMHNGHLARDAAHVRKRRSCDRVSRSFFRQVFARGGPRTLSAGNDKQFAASVRRCRNTDSAVEVTEPNPQGRAEFNRGINSRRVSSSCFAGPVSALCGCPLLRASHR